MHSACELRTETGLKPVTGDPADADLRTQWLVVKLSLPCTDTGMHYHDWIFIFLMWILEIEPMPTGQALYRVTHRVPFARVLSGNGLVTGHFSSCLAHALTNYSKLPASAALAVPCKFSYVLFSWSFSALHSKLPLKNPSWIHRL